MREILKALRLSPRFDVLQHVPFSQFLGIYADDLPAFRSLLLGEVANLGELVPSPIDDLTEAEAKLLSGILKPLVGDIRPNSKNAKALDEKVLGSVEAERRLHESIDKLKDSPAFPLLRGRKLGEFWSKGWPKAPFEECMSFRQFTEIQPDILLRKRSFTTDKVLAVVNAVNKAIISTEALMNKKTIATPARKKVPKKSKRKSPKKKK